MRKMQKWCLRRKALARVLQAATFSVLLVLMALPGMIAEAGSAGEAALLLLVMGGGAVAAGTTAVLAMEIYDDAKRRMREYRHIAMVYRKAGH